MSHISLAIVLISLLQLSSVYPNTIPPDPCTSLDSCAVCLRHSACTWCVNKSRCTKQNCGSDHAIYPDDSQNLMAGVQYCPRLVPSHPRIIKSGEKIPIETKLTQLYMTMAYTPWMCRITLNGQDTVVKAVLKADKVSCSPFEFKNDEEDSSEGIVKVLWDLGKHLDGIVTFKVCNCTLSPVCEACKNNKH